MAVPVYNFYTIKVRSTYDQIQNIYSAISDVLVSASDSLINSVISLNRLYFKVRLFVFQFCFQRLNELTYLSLTSVILLAIADEDVVFVSGNQAGHGIGSGFKLQGLWLKL